MVSATELPEDLCCDPTSFVVLTGLDVTYNAVHKSIWDAFSNNRKSDRVPISFECLLGDHAYPRAKDRRTSYEWYIPKGILKTKWMDKHLCKVPGVVVIFYELDWDEPLWDEKQLECVSRVEVVRASLKAGEDMGAQDRASALCSACGLSSKSLFILPLSDHILGYIIRLENAFYELANSYYHTEARRVRAHKEFLNKTTHQLLFVRHQFKIAFFGELMQDHTTALKHYVQAYNHVHELRSHDTNNLEVKVIGGFVNYKICRLYFLRLDEPLEAIKQFRRHVDLFKPKRGVSELVFEHSAWMSMQFEVFGGLFDEAIKAGLAAIQTQHPGFYFQQAANYARDRRTQAREICSAVGGSAYPTPDPLETDGPLDFYGQRQWRQGHQSIDPPDPNKERDGILALKLHEANVDQSRQIVPLLSAAVAQFKKYKCPRMKRCLTVHMAEEYYHAKDYVKALTLFGHTAWDYRDNKWWDVFNRIQVIAFRCAYLVANVQQYVTTAIELMGKHSKVSDVDKTRIQMNLIRVVSGEAPEPEPLTPLDGDFGAVAESDHGEALDKSGELWREKTADSTAYEIDMNKLVPFVECRTSFQSQKVHANEAIVLHVYLQTSCTFPIRFARLTVNTGNRLYDERCVVTDEKSGALYLEPNKLKHLTFSFCPDPKDVGDTVQVSTITLQLGAEANTVMLSWNMLATRPTVTRLSTKQMMQNDAPARVKKWSDIDPILKCRILTRKPLVNVTIMHHPPALIHEVYKITFVMESEETQKIENLKGTLTLTDDKSEEWSVNTYLGMDVDSVLGVSALKKIEFCVKELSPGEVCEKSVYLRFAEAGVRNFSARVSYTAFDKVCVPGEDDRKDVKCLCVSDHAVAVDAVPAFRLSSVLRNKDFESFKHVVPGGRFIAVVTVDCCSPWPVELKSSAVSLAERAVSVVKGTCFDMLAGVVLKRGETAKDAVCLMCEEEVNFPDRNNVPVGRYSLSWRRHEDSENVSPFVTSSVEIASAAIRSFPLKIDVRMPPSGVMLEQMPVTYTMRNCSDEPCEIELICEVAENFMFSGVKLQRCRLLPGSEESLTYALYPLAAGPQSLPSFRIREIPSEGRDASKPENDESLSCSYLREHIPSSIFVKPCAQNHQLIS